MLHVENPEIMFSRSSLYRELMTHREILGSTDEDKLHQRQQMTRIRNIVAARIVIYLAATNQKSWQTP